MAQDVQLPFPLKGRSDNVAFGTQPPDTTREAVNVRGMDPKTGRVRGAQRPGCSKYASAVVSSGNKVQALASISYDRPKVRYQELDGDGITVSWSSLSGGQNEGVDVDIDRQGNVYLLDRSGVVEKRNSDGVLLRTISLPSGSFLVKPRRIVVGDDDAFYVATSPDVPGEAPSSVWRFRMADDEDHFYELHWTLTFDGAVRDIDVRLGSLAVIRTPEQTEGHVDPALALYAFLTSATPLLMWARYVPNPAYGVHIDRHGSVFTTHPANTTRSAIGAMPGFNPSHGVTTATGFYTQAALHDVGLVKAPSTTTGTELPDDGTEWDISRHRIHAMLMANHLTGLVDGDAVLTWPDHRWVLGQNPNPWNYTVGGDAANPADYGVADTELDDGVPFGTGGPTDKENNRRLKADLQLDPDGSVVPGRPAPTYKALGAWRLPSVSFDSGADAGMGNPPGTVMKSNNSYSSDFKSDTDGDGAPNADGSLAGVLEHSGGAEALIPGHKVVGAPASDGAPYPGAGNGWATTQLWKIPSEDRISVLWWQRGTNTEGTGTAWRAGNMALLANCRFQLVGSSTDTGSLEPAAGYVTYVSDHIGNIRDNESGSFDGFGGSIERLATGNHHWRCVSQAIASGATLVPDMALITINHAGWNWDSGGSSPAPSQQSSIRINGVQGPKWNGGAIASSGVNCKTVVGNPYNQLVPNATYDLFYQYNADTFGTTEYIHPFSGDLCEWYTILGRTSSSPSDGPTVGLNYGNNYSVGHPSRNNSADDGVAPHDGDPSGTIDINAVPYPTAGSDDLKAEWTQKASDIEIMEGVIAHKYAIADLMPNDLQATPVAGLVGAHPFGDVSRYPVGMGSLGTAAQSSSQSSLSAPGPILAKWSAAGGELRWATNGSGLSHAVVTDTDKGVLTVGAQDPDDTGNEGAIVRKIIDYGDSYSVEHGDGAWSHTAAHNLVPSDDAFTGWLHASNTIKEDRDKTGPFGTGKAYRWYGEEGGSVNTYVYYRFRSADGNQLTDETYYTFSFYVRNYDAAKTSVTVWDSDATPDPSPPGGGGVSRQTQSRIEITWASTAEGADVGSVAASGAGVHAETHAEIGGGWWRMSCTIQYDIAHGDEIRFEITPGHNNPSDAGCYLWGPQVVTGQTAGEFPPMPLSGYRYMRVQSDNDDNLYWARGNRRSLDKYAGSDGARLWSYQHGSSQLDAVRSVALDPIIPLYDTDIKMPQNVYIATVGGESGTSTASPNLAADPEDFTAWQQEDSVTSLANTAIAPNGTLTADSVTSPASGSSTTANVRQDVVITPALNAPYTYSVYVQKEATDLVQTVLYLIDGGVTKEAISLTVDLDDGSINNFTEVETEGPGYTSGGVTISADGDYWRISFTLTDYEGGCDEFRARHYPSSQVDAHPARTIVLWGAQLTNSDSIEPYGGAPGVEPTISKLQIVGEDQVIGPESSARATRYLAIGGGNVTVLEKGLAPAAATGGTGAFDAVAPRISTALFRNRLYMTDGRTYKYYDAKDNEVVDFVSKDAGEIPKRGRLMVAWDNRLVIARTADSDHNWYMSKKGSPDKWDVYPNIWTVLDAVNGDSDRGPGQSPDIINSLIPWSDDLLLMGGDHTIQRMTGNPLAGGQIDLISDQTGISFGSPWAKDPEGVLYFFGSRGGVYAYAPGQQVTRISLDSIDRDLQDVNLGLYEIGMAWSYREDGLYIFQLPHGTGGVTQKGWFFERKTGAWYDMEFAATTLQPTAITVFDGDDPGDRIVAFGCEDGFVRFFDENAKNDDGTRIDSRVTIGPMAVSLGTRARFSRLQVALASDQDGAEYEWFSSDSPDVMGEPRIRGRLSSGRSPIIHRAISGGYLWLRLRNAAISERWAFEAASATAAPAGRARVTR